MVFEKYQSDDLGTREEYVLSSNAWYRCDSDVSRAGRRNDSNEH